MAVARCLHCALAVLLTALMAAPAAAADVTWVTNTDGSWQDSSNWSSAPLLPQSTDDVTIDRTPLVITATHAAGDDLINSLTASANLTIAGGSLSIGSSSNFASAIGGSCTIAAPGTLQVTGGTLFAYGSFNNTGTATLQNAMLSLYGGGTSSGAFNTAAGGVLDFAAGTHALGGATFSNSGTISFSGGKENFSDPITLPGVVNINGGWVNFNGSTLSQLPGATALSAGLLGGTGPVQLNNLTWSGGSIINSSSGGLTIPAAATLALIGDGYKYLNGGSTLNLAGTGTLSGTGPIEANTGTGIVFHIAPSGMLDIQSDAGFSHFLPNAVATINNEGTLRKSSGTGASSISAIWTADNTGTVQVQSGTLNFSGPFNNTGVAEVQPCAALSLAGGGSGTGTFDVAPSAALTFAGGTYTLSGGTISNNGNTTVTAGTLQALAISGTGTTAAAADTLLQGNSICQHELTIAAGARVVLGGITAPPPAANLAASLPSSGNLPASLASVSTSPATVPEPCTWLLLACAATALLPVLRRRQP